MPSFARLPVMVALPLVCGCADAVPEPATEAEYQFEFVSHAVPEFEREIRSGPKAVYCVIVAAGETGPDLKQAEPPSEVLLRLLNRDEQRRFIPYQDCAGRPHELTTPAGTKAGFVWVGRPGSGRISGGIVGWGYAEGRECTFMETGRRLLLERCQLLWEW